MNKRNLIIIGLISSVIFFQPSVQAQSSPSIHDVYVTAQEGRINDAQIMMDKVLHDHPNSAKAHFVKAELLAKQQKMAQAATELKNAERLAPGLPFAQPAAVQTLRQHIDYGYRNRNVERASYAPHGMQQEQHSSTNFLPILIGGIFLFWLIRSWMRRQNPMGNPMMNPNNPFSNPINNGAGSGFLGMLGKGAALGVGLFAGQALANRLFGNHYDNQPGNLDSPMPFSNDTEMGGNDFGINDNSSWDAGSSGNNSDDWN